MIEKHTFGGTKAGENLVSILKETYPRYVHSVSRYYHNFCLMMKHFQSFYKLCKDERILSLMNLYRKNEFNKVNKSKFPDNIKTHLLNILSVQYRVCYHKIRKLIDEKQ